MDDAVEGSENYVAEVAAALADRDDDLCRENPVLLLGSGRTLDSLRPPLTPQQEWRREHGNHRQYFLTFGRDQFGPIMYWACLDCGVPEPDCIEGKGDWATAPSGARDT